MEHSIWLRDTLIFLSAAVILLPLVQRLKSTSILGFLAVGIVIGPHGLSLITNSKDIHALAELGIVFLLFTIGLELSLSRLRLLGKYVFGLGGLQVCITAFLIDALLFWSGVPIEKALILGGALALSSTAFVTEMLLERNELMSRHGRVGQTVAKSLSEVGVAFIAVDKDPTQVEACRKLGLPLFFGDAAKPGVLKKAGAGRARVIVVALDNEKDSNAAMVALQNSAIDCPIIARSQDLIHRRNLENKGAYTVVPDTVEASLRLGEVVLETLNIAEDEAKEALNRLRQDDYALHRRIGQALARISHKFRSKGSQGCLITRRAKIWAHRRTCSTLSTKIKHNAAGA